MDNIRVRSGDGRRANARRANAEACGVCRQGLIAITATHMLAIKIKILC